MLTYAGQDLTLLTEQLLPRIQRWWDDTAPDLWSYPGYALEGIHHLPVPDRPRTPVKPRLNVLYWPTGASRWGVFHGLVDGTKAIAVQSATAGFGSTPVAANLVINDDVQNKTVTASMFMLTMRPLLVQGDADLYWITLVDKRYYFWLKTLSYTFNDGDSWSTLLTNMASAAGSTAPTVSTVSADYGTPNFLRWGLTSKPLPLLMDAAAKQVGLRYVISLDGTTAKFVDYTAAKVIADAQYTAASNTPTGINHIVLGGQNAPITGGTGAAGSPRSMIGNVPASVNVVFWGDSPSTVNTTLASLALSQYTGLNGVTGAAGFIAADQEASVASPSQADYAEQAATDYYLWLLSLNDFTARGTLPIESSGLEDRIEWEYLSLREAAQRVVTGELSAQEMVLRQTHPIRWLTRVVPTDWHDVNIYGGAPPGTIASEANCNKLATLKDTACLRATVISASGQCENVPVDQYVLLDDEDSDEVWLSSGEIETDTGSFLVTYEWPNESCCPKLTLYDGDLSGTAYVARYLGCFNGKHRFIATGSTVCMGTAEDCVDNGFVIEVECSDVCPNPDYGGPGWYCVSITGCGVGDTQDCIEYTEDPGSDVTLCSGPHVDEATCAAVCSQPEYDCVSGDCVETVGGAYSDIFTCISACGNPVIGNCPGGVCPGDRYQFMKATVTGNIFSCTGVIGAGLVTVADMTAPLGVIAGWTLPGGLGTINLNALTIGCDGVLSGLHAGFGCGGCIQDIQPYHITSSSVTCPGGDLQVEISVSTTCGDLTFLLETI